MIVDIPSPDEFKNAGIGQLFLGWRIAMDSVHDFRRFSETIGDLDQEATDAFWQSAQPSLANAFSLVQQGMEMGLKSKIAEVSPYILIGNDPKDWPRRVANQDTSFGEFRTLDAADLVKVHNSLITPRLSEEFIGLWDQVRRDRNRIIHSVASDSFEPETIVRTILMAAATLFNHVPWPQQLIQQHDTDRNALYGYDDYTYNIVMQEVDDAISFLTPADAKRFFGFDKSRRAYLCPKCHYAANRGYQDDWPHLAQLRTRQKGEAVLDCIVCETPSLVERTDCMVLACKGNVISEGFCLTCSREQSHVFVIESELIDDGLPCDREYEFTFAQDGGRSAAPIVLKTADDAGAMAYGKKALEAPHLAAWESVTIRQGRGGLPLLDKEGDRVLGCWKRVGAELSWLAGEASDRVIFAIDD